MICVGTGNLLEAQTDALVNTVNCVGVMGKGIALQFKKAWPEMFKAYRRAARAGEVKPGHMHVHETHQLVGPRLIINFPTKRHWRERSQLADIEAGLVDLVRVIRERGLRSVAIPPLGAGLGGLDWPSVRTLIVAAFEPLPEVEVHLWAPGGAPAPASRPVGTPRPRMTPTRAMVLALMDRYGVMDHAITHLEVQKLAYLLQLAGAPLKLRFAPEQYGPYADGLYHVLQHLEGHQISGLTDRDPHTALHLQPEAVREADAFLAEDADARDPFERVLALIEGFETPYGMELLATAHWVTSADRTARANADACVRGCHAWNPRKRRILRPAHIKLAWARLHELGWLNAAQADGAA
jgi:O-acetyl-ADP-ribose deacetylase (regulator of RNase III)